MPGAAPDFSTVCMRRTVREHAASPSKFSNIRKGPGSAGAFDLQREGRARAERAPPHAAFFWRSSLLVLVMTNESAPRPAPGARPKFTVNASLAAPALSLR